METAPTPTANAGPRIETITLETPIARGDTTIATLQIRKPTAGELRGLQLQSLMQGDVNAIIALIPRITLPPLIQHEAEQLELADLAAICGTVTGFFMSKAELGMLMRVMGAVETEPSTA
jgi:uncharacterized protein involved in outer membrane biogenesis